MLTWDSIFGIHLIVVPGFALALWYANQSHWRFQVVSGVFAALQVLAIFATLWLLSTSLLYPLFSGYYDHFEATAASLSWMLYQSDQPLYHSLQSYARYSASYGPMLFLLDGLSSFLPGSAISVSKLPGIVACAASVCILFAIVRRHCGLHLALVLIGLFVLCLLNFRNTSYWNRPDPFLVLCVTLGLATVSTSSTRMAAICLGIITGIAINLKVHGAIYLLPVFVLFVVRRPGTANLLIAISCVTLVFTAPFLLQQISLGDYLQSLTVAPRHGLSPSVLATSIMYLTILLTPLIGACIIGSSRASPPHFVLLVASFIIASLVITVISAKRGSGPHHYLPMLPTLVYWCSLVLYQQGKEDFLKRIITLPSAFFGFLLLATSYMVVASMAVRSQAWIVVQLTQNTAYKEASHELRQILANYPTASIQMGYSDESGYPFTLLRPLVVTDGNSYWLDASALMDYDAAGIAMPESTLEALASCSTQVWILPAVGTPFSMTNYYATSRNIFGARFARVFLSKYELVQSERYYTVWKCRSVES